MRDGLDSRGRWLGKYTLLWLMVMVPVLGGVLLFGKGLLWRGDSYVQHYPALAYTADAIRGLFAGRGFKLVDPSLGQGLDVLTTLGYYGLADPLVWPAALFTGAGLEVWYHVRILAYIYLAGAAFCLYLRTIDLPRGGNGWLTALSGMIYISSAYVIIGTLNHPFFAVGALFLPLELTGVERVFRGRRFLTMTLTTAAMLAVNFYFAWHVTLMAIVYILVRLAFNLKVRGVRESAGDGFALLGSYLLGAAIGAVVLLPTALAFLGTSRSGQASGYTASMLHYPLSYYVKLFLTYAAPYDYAGFWSIEGYSPLALIGAVMLFLPGDDADKGLRRLLGTGFLLGAVFLCVPLAGRVFNGLGYVTNRWCYGFAWINAVIAAWALPKLAGQGDHRKRVAAVAALVAAGLMLAGGAALRSPGILIGAAAVAGAGILLLATKRRGMSLRLLSVATALCCVAYTAGYGFAAAFDDNYQDLGVDRKLRSTAAAAANRLPSDGLGRVDTDLDSDSFAAYLGYAGTGYYWSLIPGAVSDYARDLELSTQYWSFRQQGLGGDPWLCAAAGVTGSVRAGTTYPVTVTSEYRRIGEAELADGGTAAVYENPLALPVGVVFHETLSESAYRALSPVEKRQALLRYAVLPLAVLAESADRDADFVGEAVPFEVGETRDAALDLASRQISGGEGGMVELRFDAPADASLYLVFSGTRVTDCADENSLQIATLMAAGQNRAYFIRPEGNFNYDQTGACVYLGDTGDGCDECWLRFTVGGALAFGDLSLVAVPLSAYREAAAALHDGDVWRPEIGVNRLSGGMDMTEDGVLQIRLPWLMGWRAKVDGEPTELMRCGGMYMGLALDAGHHEIELDYMTPGLPVGAAVSGAALILALVLALALRRRRA